MNFDDLTEKDLQALRQMPKRASQQPKRTERRSAFHADYRLTSGEYAFSLYMRQNMKDLRNYSVGILAVNLPGKKKKLTLSRYNGSNHVHGEFHHVCHVHHTTADSQHDAEPESGRVVRGNYSDIKGALSALMKEYNVHGIEEVLL